MENLIDALPALATASVGSFLVCVLILMTQPLHRGFSMDADIKGIQKFHASPVPRVGGLAVIAGMTAAPLYLHFFHKSGYLWPYFDVTIFAVLAGIPAFISGFAEDITKNISVRVRLNATFLSALMCSWLLGAFLNRVNIVGLDFLLQFAPVSLVLTAIAVAGVANSINIIDGFNGIAAGAVIIMLAGIAFLAQQVNDLTVFNLALVGIGAALGIFIVNFPRGRLFMGDGGAYLLGFWVAEMAVLLVVRNNQINAWQLLAICAYPVTEVIFSMYRRRLIRKVAAGAPDRLHLHTLLYRRLICTRLQRNSKKPWIRNAAVACLMLPYLSLTTLIATVYGRSIAAAFLITLLQVFAYVAVYGRLVRGHWCFRPTVFFGFRRETKERPV